MYKTKQNGFLYLINTLMMKNICQNPGGNTLCDYPGAPGGVNFFLKFGKSCFFKKNIAENNIFHYKLVLYG
jgi:hypothetical protein